MPKRDGVWSGNAFDAGQKTKQWFVGSFMPEGSLLNQKSIEVKLDRARAGKQRSQEEATSDSEYVSLATLISGKVTYCFPTHNVTLEKQGDSVLWDRNILHWWRIEQNSVIQTIRWKP